MARTIAEIQSEIITNVQAEPNLSDMSSTSDTALWRLITRVVAKAIAVLEILWNSFKLDVDNTIATKKPHTAKWYNEKTRAFQLGDALVDGEDYYDNVGLTAQQIADRKTIAQAAVIESDGDLIIKVAKELAGVLVPLTSSEYNAFVDYINSIKDAGVRLSVLSFNADRINMTVDVYYDPLILDMNGARLDGTNTNPVKVSIDNFLRSLPFNGLFVKAHLVDAIQQVEGVFVPEIRSAIASRFDVGNGLSIDIEYQPYSGFLHFYDPADLTLNFIPHV